MERRKRAALSDSLNMLQTVLDSIPSGVFWKDRDLIYMGGNHTFLEATGLKSSEELVGKSDYDLPWEKEQARRYRKHDRKVIQSGIPEYNIIEPYRRADGTSAWASTNKVPLRNTEGDVVGVLGTYEDITDRKRAEQRMQMFSHEIIAARENERMQTAAVLHHDLGSLAVGVSAFLDAIEVSLRAGKSREALEWTKRTRRLFEESVIRLKEVSVQLRPPELDTIGLRAALRQHFSLITKQKRVRIQFTESLAEKRVSGDTATTLFRTVQEALTNAIAHGDAKRVDVCLSASSKAVSLIVRDNGRGFSLSDDTARAKPQIGIRVMKEMTASCGGSFKIHSRPGKGTTVRVSLPFEGAVVGPGDTAVQRQTAVRPGTTPSATRGSRLRKGRVA